MEIRNNESQYHAKNGKKKLEAWCWGTQIGTSSSSPKSKGVCLGKTYSASLRSCVA